MEPIVASLCSSFRRVPPAAVPAMLDCVLASTSASPSSIFTALLNEFPNITKGIRERSETIEWEWRNIIVSYVAALSHSLKKSDVPHMPMFIWKTLIPLLKLLHACDCELFNEVACLFLDVVKETNSWEVLETIMVPLLLRSIGLSVGVFQSEDLAIYKWSLDSTYNGSNNGEVSPESFDDYHDQLSEKDTHEEFSVSNCSDFPLSMSCNVLTLALDAALRSNREGVVAGSTSVNVLHAKVFAGNVLWDLSNLTLQMLSTSVELRSSAIRLLLPFIFKAFSREFAFEVSVCGKHHKLTRTEFFMKIWQSCKLLFSLESLERRDAYDILSLYLSFPYPTDEHENVNVCGGEKSFDIRADQQFWDEIKRGLLDKESLVRKQSLHILKTTINLNKERNGISEKVSDVESSGSTMMSKRGRWADNEAKSLGIGKICNHTELNDTGRRRWETFVFLYEMLEEYGTHLVEAAWSHQITTWLQSSFSPEDSVNIDDINLQCERMTTMKQLFEWLAVLWERGLCHDNPQVRCIIMQSLLDVEWENYRDYAKLVPKDFILGPLIRGLNDPVHHRGFGLKEIYSSWTIDAAARFLHEYVSYMEGREHILFLIDLASVPKTHSLGRAGLVCLAECIASAAYRVPKQSNNGNDELFDATTDNVLVETGQSSSQNDRTELLECLRFVLECSKQHFNPKYRHQVCRKILAAATTLISAINGPLGILMNFISSLPREYTDYGGSLRHVVQKWLCGPKLQLLEDIGGFPKTFISCNPQDNSVTYSDEELDAWESEAKRWARVLFLLVEEEEHFYPITKFIQDHGGDICKQRNNLEWLAVKFLILVSSLVQELQVIQERTAKSRMMRRTKMDLDFPGSLDHLYFREESFIFDKFLAVLLSFMEELVSFTKLSCSIFWLSVVTGDMTLPGSIRGRLGGPSQRRLSSSLCSSVLEAVTSIKTLAFISWWSAQFSTDTSINSAHAFLWNFCWKIIRFQTCKSEVQAEICIAAHESCAYLLKYLVSVFSPLSLDLVINNDESFPREPDGEGLLDAFISTFLQNINNVIDGGNLARTRRAVLMNWKWSCLESLLSLPNYALRNGVDPEICKYLFSGTVVKEIFDDLIGSLENAGEGSVLSMLRSVRLSIKLLASNRSGPLFSSDGITIQMMWLLVNSSWILHVNCNKRRVAPIAALLSSVLHSSVFGDEAMHEFNGEPGPLKWFVEKILEEGTKSPRTIRLAALHLSGLWLAYPNILKYYMEELKLLTFYGSVAFDEDFEGELVENYEASTEVSVLSRSLDPELTEGFINTELYARVSIAVLFSKLADMVDLANPIVGNKGSLLIVASGKTFLLELLDSVVNDKDLSKELYKKYSAIHRRKVRAWQMICVLSRFVDADIVDQVTSSLHTSIYRNNLPSVRQYMETFAIRIYLKFPLLVGQQLVCFLRSYDLRPQALSSYVFIAANVILHSKEVQFRNLDELLPPIIPLLTSHHHTLRGFTQILVYKVLQTLLPDLNSDEHASISLEKRCFLDLRSYLAQNSDCARLRASMDSYLDGFDPVMSISPAGIFTNRVEEFEFECVPTTLMERVIDFLNNTREDLRSSMAKDAAAIKNESLHIAKGPQFSENVDSNGAELVHQSPKDIIYDFQKKITTVSKHEVQDSASTLFSNDKELYRSLLDMENEDQLLDQLLHPRGVIVEKSKASRQQIILMASLIDRIPNLAGLARTCEVFKAAGLAIADKNILNDKQFRLISVTAEKWVPVLEVPLGSMKVFLEKKKQEGFAILGLEQTANSIPLDHYKFPTKTVLVLGREKEGIPVEFIHMLDACIEIPQLGIVRSLNVHVSGAIALWEYTRQLRQR